MKLALFLLCVSAQATTTINSISATATQALVSVTRPTSSTITAIKISEDSAFGTVVDDTNATLFTNADVEAGHVVASAVSGTNTILILRMGLRVAQQASDNKWHSRALASATHYYITLTGDTTPTSQFQTGIVSGISPEGPPTDPNGWGQLGNPEYTDFSKPVIEPHSGLKISSADPAGWGSSATVAISTTGANWFSGQVGWTNPNNIATYGGAGTTVPNQNTVCVFLNVDGFLPGSSTSIFGGYWPYNGLADVAMDLYGSGTDASGTNRTIQGAMSTDSCQTNYTPLVNVTFPQTTQAAVGTLPSTYPGAYFSSWGGKALPRSAFPRIGYVSVSSGVVTLTQARIDNFGHVENIGLTAASDNAYFDLDWKPNTKIYINGSSATCTNNFCTIASVQSATQLTLVETGTSLGGNNFYHSAALSMVLQKTTATGSITFSARWKVANTYPQNLGTGGCARQTVTASDGAIGYPCIFPGVRQNPGALYLMVTSGTGAPSVRLISQFPNNGCTNGGVECPSSSANNLGPQTAQFLDTDPSQMYVVQPTNAGSGTQGLFKVQYQATTGTACGGGACGWLPWTHWNTAYSSISIVAPVTHELIWTNLTPCGGSPPCSTGLDLRSQILAHTTFNETLWGSAGNLNTAGFASPYMILYNLSGSQNNACWIHAFTASTGLWYKSWRSDDWNMGGQNISNGLGRYAGCHAITAVDGSSATNGPAFILATHTLNAGTSQLEAGPYTGTITAVSKSGAFSSNTSLPWPIDSTYDSPCPGGLPAWLTARGAISNQCVQVQGLQPCNTFAGGTEAAALPCPYNAAWGYLNGLQIGDMLKDNVVGGDDNEGFLVVTTPTLALGSTCPGTCIYQWTMQRNANFSYCAFGNSASLVPPKNGIASAAQMTHSTGWGYHMVPRDSCAFAALWLIDIVGNAGYAYNTFTNTGHGDTSEVGVGTFTRIASGSQDAAFNFIYTLQNQRAFNQVFNFNDAYLYQSPKFANYDSAGLQTQSYVNCKGFTASTILASYCNDFSHFNGAGGQDLEAPRQIIGGPQGLILQGGTTGVYLVPGLNGTPDIKHQGLNHWVGRRYILDVSGPGSLLTDATPYRQCQAYKGGECRPGSSAGALYVQIPALDTVSGATSGCWASQINLNIDCPFAGPTEGGQARRIGIGVSDNDSLRQSFLGWLGMGPGQQYVYSNFVTTPDGLYGMFSGYLTNGYHTGLMMAKLPPPANDSISRSTFSEVDVQCLTGTTCLVEFGYEEYGSDLVNKFYCTTRAENCRVASATINEAVPFSFATTDAALTPISGTIRIPALPNHVLFYRTITAGSPGPTIPVTVP